MELLSFGTRTTTRNLPTRRWFLLWEAEQEVERERRVREMKRGEKSEEG